MHGQKREIVIKSHLKLVLNKPVETFDDLKQVINSLLFKKPFHKASYIRSVLSTLRVRCNLSQRLYIDGKSYLNVQNRLILSAYHAFCKRQSQIFNTKGECVSFEQICGEQYLELFHSISQVSRRHITQHEAICILDFLAGNKETYHELELLLRLIWCNGSRKSEVYQLNDNERLHQLQKEKHTTVQGKSVANQDFIIDDSILDFLMGYIDTYMLKGGAPKLFCLTERTHLNMYKRVLQHLGINAKCSIHHWRSLFSVRAMQLDGTMCQNLLNHSDIMMTKHYQRNGIVGDFGEKILFLNRLNSSNDKIFANKNHHNNNNNK